MLYSDGVTTVSTVHGPLYEARPFARMGPLIGSYLFRGDSLVTIVNRDLEGYVRRQIGRSSANPKLRFIPNGVDVSFVRGAAEHGGVDASLLAGIQRARESGSVVLCFVGRLEERKGPSILIRAIPALRKEWPNLLSIFVGDGPIMERLKEAAHRMEIGDNVAFMGFQENPYAIMLRSDFVLTNLSSKLQGLSLVHLETLALGKRLVTRGDEEKRAALPGSVFYTNSDDPDELAKVIQDAWRDSRADHPTGSEVPPSFLWDEVAAEYLRAYKEVLAARA